MKKWLFIILLLFKGIVLPAQTADTIVVKAHQDVNIQTNPAVGRTLYPVWAEFPAADVEYYKILAYLTFECADGKPCGEWDYINYIRLGKIGGQNGDSLGWEIARYITPYGNYWATGSKWKHGWYYDLTDYSSLLRDSVQVVYEHTGYETSNRGWKINLTFYIIPGTPPLSIHNISPLWVGSYQYGNPDNPITDKLTTKYCTIPRTTKMANIKIIQTGHGMDKTDNCAEFCEKWRQVLYDGRLIDDRVIFRECGFNSLYPQAGTWLYDRANWCPGEDVPFHDLYVMVYDNAKKHTIDLMMEPYESEGDFGNWTITSYFVEYGEPNYEVDVSIEEIIAPSKEYGNVRYNPICGVPIIKVKNNGSETLTSMAIQYGPRGGEMATFNWTGNLSFLESEIIELPGVPDWNSGDESQVFEVAIINPNGKPDQFPQNNMAYAPYDMVEIQQPQIVVSLTTNKAPTENYYYLIDLSTMEVLLDRNGFQARTTYRDSLTLKPGCYALEFYDDGPPPPEYDLNKDGLSWWANSYDGSGSFRINSWNLAPVKVFKPDFGTKILYQFMVTDEVALTEDKKTTYQLDIIPNPASDRVQINYNFNSAKADNKNLIIKDLFGRNLKEIPLKNSAGTELIDISAFPKGVYFITLKSNGGMVTSKMIVR